MKTRLRPVLILPFIFTFCFCDVSYGQADLAALQKVVQEFRDSYLDSLDNVHCEIAGVDAYGIEYTGKIAVLNRALPYTPFPDDGAIMMSRVPAWKGTSPNGEHEGLKFANPQYSFNLTRRLDSVDYAANDVLVQLDNLAREDLAADLIAFSIWSTDAQAIWAPLYVFDISLGDLLAGIDGVETRGLETNAQGFRVEFKFPSDHRFGHESAVVHISQSGKMNSYELVTLPSEKIRVKYEIEIEYDDSNRAGIPMPREVTSRSQTVVEGKPIAPTSIVCNLSNYEFGNVEMHEFTLSNFGIPEPPGTTVVGQDQIWLWGIGVGSILLLVGMVLRNRAKSKSNE